MPGPTTPPRSPSPQSSALSPDTESFRPRQTAGQSAAVAGLSAEANYVTRFEHARAGISPPASPTGPANLMGHPQEPRSLFARREEFNSLPVPGLPEEVRRAVLEYLSMRRAGVQGNFDEGNGSFEIHFEWPPTDAEIAARAAHTAHTAHTEAVNAALEDVEAWYAGLKAEGRIENVVRQATANGLPPVLNLSAALAFPVLLHSHEETYCLDAKSLLEDMQDYLLRVPHAVKVSNPFVAGHMFGIDDLIAAEFVEPDEPESTARTA